MKITTCCLLIFVFYVNAGAQHYNSYQYFTTKEGLPTNFIYKCVQDKRGLLWVCTDAGVLRFDGKNFELYTTRDGLPDVEVLEIIMDSSGTIWANTFQHDPGYYNPLTNRFVNVKEDTSLAKVKDAALTLSFALKYGGVTFVNRTGTYFFGRKISSIKAENPITPRFCIENKKDEFWIGYSRKIFQYSSTRLIDSLLLDPAMNNSGPSVKISGNNIYVTEKNDTVLKCYNNIDFKNKKYSITKTVFSTPILLFNITENYACVCLQNGEIYLLDKHTLQVLEKLSIKATVNGFYEDRNSTLWLCTTDKGLIKASFNPIQNIALPDSFHNTSFISIAIDSSGNILAGNRFGEIAKIKGKNFEINKIPTANRDAWIRKVIIKNNNVYTLSENGFYCNYSDTSYSPYIPYQRKMAGFKSGAVFNDSLLLIGCTDRLMLFNIYTHSCKILNREKRNTAVIATYGHQIYAGSTNGLFKWIKTDSMFAFNTQSELLGSRIISLAATKDNIVWVATASNGVIVLYNDSVIANITTQNNLASNLCRSVYVQDTTVWLSTGKGISKINYHFMPGGPFSFSIENFGEAEGLHKESVNEMVAYHDTIYAATTNGIIFFPVNISTKKDAVNTYITGISINGKDTALLQNINLAYNQNYINLKFATVDLTGSTYTWQYRLNNKPWINISTNTISLQLSSGDYTIQIRPVDINNRIIERNAEIILTIKPAIWQTIWFWIIVSAFVTAMLLWQYNRVKLKKQKRLYEQQSALMKERNRITADLHDDVGSSLSSLQINSVIARQIMETDKGKAKHYLDKVIEQSADISSNVSDIIWSMKSQEDRLVDLDGRIRNTVSNLLGATNINYKIEIEAPLEDLVQNITARKNMMLIIKEAINNCAKYSNASEFTLHVEMADNALMLTISDNGKGIPANKMKVGNGLQNMRKRTEELKGEMHLETAGYKGVQLKFIIPVTEIRG